MRGYRKLAIVAILALATMVAEPSDNQAAVLKTLAVAGLASNAAVHFKDVFNEAMVRRRASGAGSGAGSADGEEKE